MANNPTPPYMSAGTKPGKPGVISTIYDSTFVSNLDLHKPQVLNTLFKRYNNQGSAYLLTRSLGFERPVAGDTYGHFEEDLYHETFKQHASVDSDASTENKAPVTLKLAADRAHDAYVRVGDIITFPDETQGIVTVVVSEPTNDSFGNVTVLPLGNYKLPAVTRGTELAITSAAFPEGSGMPDPVASGVTYFDNDAQIIKEAIGVTGSELVNETWIAQFNEAGEFQGYYRTGQAQMDYRMMTKIDGMFLVGQRFDNTGGRAVNAAVSKYANKTSMGLIPSVRQYGNIHDYFPSDFSMADFDDIDVVLEREFVGSDVPLWFPMGLKLYQEVENMLVDYLANTNIEYARKAVNQMLFKGDEALGVSINFTYIQKSSRTFLLHKMGGFSNLKTYGLANYPYENMGLIIPLDKGKDPKTKEDIPSIGTRYRAMGAYNRRMITTSLHGIGATPAGGIPVHTIDKSNTYQMVHMGNEFFGLNRMIIIDPTGDDSSS